MATLTYKSFVLLGQRSERSIEPSRSWFFRSFPRRAGVQQHHQESEGLEESGTCRVRPIPKLIWVKNSFVSFGEPLGHVITLRGPCLASGTGDDSFSPSLQSLLRCRFKTCVIQNASVCTGTTSTCCVHMWRRCESTYWNFQRATPHAARHTHTHTTTTATTTNNGVRWYTTKATHTTSHGDTERDRERRQRQTRRGKGREGREGKGREGKRREEKRREDKTVDKTRQLIRQEKVKEKIKRK